MGATIMSLTGQTDKENVLPYIQENITQSSKGGDPAIGHFMDRPTGHYVK
jgi:hypothetical protein